VINANFKLDWHGGDYTRKLHAALGGATSRAAEIVRRRVKEEYLNESGKAATTRAGLNKAKTLAGRWNAGVNRLGGLNVINLGHKQLAFGGSTTARNRKRQTYAIDRVYWYGEPLHRWVQSSPPGTSPYKQTGTLQRSIAVEKTHNGLRAKIGPGRMLKYARIQELGGRTRFGTLPPRPYMQPAFQASIGAIMFQYQLAIARASK
jgi:phage gpG-like protein